MLENRPTWAWSNWELRTMPATGSNSDPSAIITRRSTTYQPTSWRIMAWKCRKVALMKRPAQKPWILQLQCSGQPSVSEQQSAQLSLLCIAERQGAAMAKHDTFIRQGLTSDLVPGTRIRPPVDR